MLIRAGIHAKLSNFSNKLNSTHSLGWTPDFLQRLPSLQHPLAVKLMKLNFLGSAMSISNSSGVSAAVSQVSPQDQRSVLVLKKALDSQAQTAAALIEALPKPISSNHLPPYVGRTINTTA